MEASQVEQQLEVMPPAVRDWILSLAQPDEITDLHYSREVLEDGYEVAPDGQHWVRWKRGPHMTVTIERSFKNFHKQVFVKKSETGEWTREEETNGK